jgi:hypothetical protein
MKTKETKQDRIHAFKALDKDFKCKDFQFEIGKSYHEDNVKICERGFHSCLNPFDILNYYDLTECRFAEVEIWGKMDKRTEDTKIASSDICIKRELSLTEFISIVHDYMYNECKISDTASSGYGSQLASSGDWSQLASSGDRSQLASSGDWSKLASSGYGSQLASSGYGSKLASSGYGSQLASSGDRSKLASSGDRSKLA